MGILITFEGIEGTGKTTQIQRLAANLTARGHQVISTREPGGCPISNQIRSILLDSKNSGITRYCELFLYLASRAQHVQEVIVPALKSGTVVLCDRYTDATLAYQGHARGFDLTFLEEMNRITIEGCAPDLTFLLDCDPKVGLGRALSRIDAMVEGPKEDRFEQENLSFHEKVRSAYLALARQEPKRFEVLSAELSPDELEKKILERTLERI